MRMPKWTDKTKTQKHGVQHVEHNDQVSDDGADEYQQEKI